MSGVGRGVARTFPPACLAVALVMVAGLLSSCMGASAGGGCVEVAVAVTAELEPIAVRDAAGFDGKVHGRCVKVNVRSLSSSHGAAVASGAGDRRGSRPARRVGPGLLRLDPGRP